MEKLCLSLLSLLIGICFSTQAQQEGNTVFNEEGAAIYIFLPAHNSLHYLTAIHGGGDELISQKDTEEPGVFKQFFLKYRGEGKGGFGLFEKEFEVIIRKKIWDHLNAYLTLSDQEAGIAVKDAQDQDMPIYHAKVVKDGFALLKFGPVKYELSFVFGKKSTHCQDLAWKGDLRLINNKEGGEVTHVDLSQAGTNWVFANTIIYASRPSVAKISLQEGYGCKIDEVQIKNERKIVTWKIGNVLEANEVLTLDWDGSFEITQ